MQDLSAQNERLGRRYISIWQNRLYRFATRRLSRRNPDRGSDMLNLTESAGNHASINQRSDYGSMHVVLDSDFGQRAK